MYNSEYHSKYQYHGNDIKFWSGSNRKLHHKVKNNYWSSIPSKDIRPAEYRKVKKEDGTEKKELVKPETRRVVLDYYAYKSVIDQRFTVYEFPSSFMPSGQYSFPFTFMLPKGLPANYESDWKKDDRSVLRISPTPAQQA